MTLVAAWKDSAGNAFLAGDVLITAPPTEPAVHRRIPTRDGLARLDLPRSIAQLRQKAYGHSDRLAVGWADSPLCAGVVLRELRREFRGATPRLHELRQFLRAQGVGPPHCVLVGVLLEEENPTGFSWWSAEPGHLEPGLGQAAGSGAEVFTKLFKMRPFGVGEFKPFDRALWRLGFLLGNEVIVGSTLRQSFGGGFQILHTENGVFVPQHSITYVFLSAVETEKGTIVKPADRALKFEFADDVLHVLTAVAQAESPTSSRLQCVLPVFAESADGFTLSRRMSLASDHYCICCTVRMRDRLGGNLITISERADGDLLQLSNNGETETIAVTAKYAEAVRESVARLDRNLDYPDDPFS